jgi:hypothetical protein
VWAVEDRYPDTVENHQYPGEVDKDGNHVPYEYERVSPPSALELYKLIRCYLYQCSEGDIDKKPLFIALDTYCQSVAEHIVMNSPQYDALPWDI